MSKALELKIEAAIGIMPKKNSNAFKSLRRNNVANAMGRGQPELRFVSSVNPLFIEIDLRT
jgi:hypothetical protein